jgi:IS30 family transposase
MKNYNHLTKRERRKIYSMRQSRQSIVQIAKKLQRAPSTISRELKRNQVEGHYLPDSAQQYYKQRYKGRPLSIKPDTPLYHYIRRGLEKGWSPEQISGRMKCQKKPYYACHETIYQYIYKTRQGKTWYAYLMRSKPYRGKRLGGKKGSGKYQGIRSIHQRPQKANMRSQIGHWEGDTLRFSSSQDINVTTLVDRLSRLTLMFCNQSRKSEDVFGQIKAYVQQQERRIFKTLTLDQGSEFGKWREFEEENQCRIYYADPHSPWQRGSNENMNGRIRRYLPRTFDVNGLTEESLSTICKKINNTPRKILGFKKPKELLKLGSKKDCCTSKLNPPPLGNTKAL